MYRIAAALLCAALMIGVADAADSTSRKQQRREYDSYAAKYPGATPRQLRNARAYDRGEYYEMDSNAHPVGSRGWWELKQREGNGRGGFRN